MAVVGTQNIFPFLWFDGQAEEAMKLYTSIFPDSKICRIRKWGEGTPFPADQVMIGTIIIDGLTVHLFDAGPQFKFNESVSFFVLCDTQQEIDTYWKKLTENGGQESMCGWLKDKFGFSWQIVPRILADTLSDGESVRAGKMFQAMMNMKKLDIQALEKAYNS